MAQHAQDYSIAGTFDLTFNTDIKGNSVVAFFAGNHISGPLFGSGGEAAMTGVHAVPESAAWAMGNTLAYGPMVNSGGILTLNLGKSTLGGLTATNALGWNTNLAAKGILSTVGRVLNMGMSLEMRLGIDIGFTLAEAAGCSIHQ